MNLTNPVAYMEDEDFDNKGKLINPDVPKEIPVVIMVQSSRCSHCVNAKPAFQKFAEKNNGKVFCATIQADGDRESEKILGERINVLKKDFRGYPDYFLYIDGIFVDKEIRGRNVNDLESFVDL